MVSRKALGHGNHTASRKARGRSVSRNACGLGRAVGIRKRAARISILCRMKIGVEIS